MTGDTTNGTEKKNRVRRPQTAKGGGFMSGFIVLFACCVAAVMLAMYMFEKSEKTAYHKMQGDFSEWKTTYTAEVNKKYEDANSSIKSLAEGNVALAQAEAKEAKELVDKMLVEMRGMTNEHKTMMEKISISDRVARDARKQVESLQEHNAKMREQLIMIAGEISKKKIVVQWKGAFPIEVYPGTKKIDKTKKRSTKSH